MTNFKYRTAVAALALFATMACGGTANEMAAAQGVTVGVLPDHAEIPPRGTQGFAALVTGSAETAVRWSVQGGAGSGSVSSAGLYTAPATTGTFTVVATSAADPTKSATATVTVTTSASGAVSIAVSPSSVSVPTGTVQSFVATVTNSTNTAATWSVQEGAAGGTITASGVYTAPPTAGTYHVIATSVADTTKKATATVTVTGSTPGTVAITVGPTSTSVPTGAIQNFTATVTNSSNTSANWSVQEGPAGGTITAGGVYTAPASAGTYHVIATSAADPSKSATATVVVYTPVAVDASIIPADRRTVWNPGIPGGIPNVTTIHTTINAATYGNGTTDATSAINNAIQAAGATAASTKQPQVVFLPAGTYRTSGTISIDRSNVVLRGAGKGKTIINNQSVTAAAVSIWGGQGYFKTTPVVNVVGSVAKGAATIEVANAAGFAVGDILHLDQLADGVPDGPANGVALYPGNWVWILDSWWSLRSPYANYGGDGGLSGKFPDSPNGYRPIAQQVEVLAKTGNVLTIYDPITGRGSPAHLTFPASQNPQIWRSAGQAGYDVVRYAGLEDMTVWSSANSGDAKDMITVGAAAYCWIKGVETDGSKNTWAGRHIHLFSGTYRCEVRQCYSHNSSNYNQGSNAYGIIYSGSECLIEDNVVRELNKPILGETTGGGNVIAYNYVDEAVIGSLTNGWQETGINMSHGSFSHSDLFEGNHTPNVGVDSTHGNNGWGVMFRNWATGRNGSGGTSTYLRAIYVDGWSREMASVGNVLWQPGLSCDYLGIPTPAVNVVYGGVRFIYLLGSNAWTPGTGNKPGADSMDNGQAASLFHRHMDFDYKSNSVYNNPANPVKTLPASLYLKGKPAFFGSSTWPWVDPGGATKVYTLPAKARFDAGTP